MVHPMTPPARLLIDIVVWYGTSLVMWSWGYGGFGLGLAAIGTIWVVIGVMAVNKWIKGNWDE